MNKILYLPTRYFPAISGAELYIQRLAEILQSRYNYQVSILTSNAIDFRALRSSKGKIIKINNKYFKSVNNVEINRFSINYDDNLEKKIEKLHQIESFKLLNISNETLRKILKNGPYLDNVFENFGTLISNNYKLIHTTFYPYFNLILALMIGKNQNIPTICTPFFHFSNPRYLDSDMIEILKAFDLLIACTEIEKRKIQELLNIPNSKIQVIPMGVDYNAFSNSDKDKGEFNFKKHFFQKAERKYKMILFCGYKNFEKGAISILKAIPNIINRYKKVYFVFIGPSTIAFNRELSKIHKLKDARIINLSPDNLTGYLDKKKISAFKHSDIYLMPSRSDAFGIAFLEAWAASKPVIGANIGATPQVIRNNIDGLLVEFNNEQDISNKVLTLLKSKRLRNKYGLEGNLKVLHYYTWERIAAQTHELYNKFEKRGEEP